VPDTYQGTEVWNFSLVDPDNRRPVDYAQLRQMLSQLQSRLGDRTGLARELLGSMEDGRVKLYLTWQALCCRRDRPGLFSAGDYLPAEAAGPMKDHVFGFVRLRGDECVVAVVPRLLAPLVLEEGDLPLGGVWEDTDLRLPEGMPPGGLRNVFTGEIVTPAESDGRLSVPLTKVFAHFPVALFVPAR
jgi:(1->4)-alpha-D-glucan 1-alpha-D-glucosylmutase